MRKITLSCVGAMLLAILPPLLPTPASAQAFGWLKGKVSDEIRNPIARAQIMVKSAEAEYKIEADEKGRYRIRVPAGELRVLIKERPGFAEYRRDKVRVKSGAITVLNITPESRIHYEDCDKGLLNP